MAEGRMLKREIANSKKLGKLRRKDKARVMYFMILPHLDIEGRHIANPHLLKGQVMTMLEYSQETIQAGLEALHEVGLIILYTVNGEQYLEYTRFGDFQKLYPSKEAGSKIPGPTLANSGELRRTPGKEKGSKVKRREVKGSKDKNIYISIFDLAMKEFYGTKRGLQTEFDNFQKKHKDWENVLPLLLPAIKGQIASRSQLRGRNEFVPPSKNFKTWINNRCWEEIMPEKPKSSKPLCSCGCGKEGQNSVGNKWYATSQCRIKVEKW